MKKTGSNMPQTVQPRFHSCMENLEETTAVPRCTAHDLKPAYSRTRIGSWGDEGTFEVTGTGNKVTEGKNY